MSDFISFVPRVEKPDTRFGFCEECNVPLEAVWFKEEETVVENGCMYHTGRYRRAVDYLICPCCLHRECVDDTFDGPWIMGRC